MSPVLFSEHDYFELRLFLEELVGDLSRRNYAACHGGSLFDVRIRHEVKLGSNNVYADMLVESDAGVSYFVEVDFGYSGPRIIESLERKFGQTEFDYGNIDRLVLVVDQHRHSNWGEFESEIRRTLPTSWKLDIWNEQDLLTLIHEYYSIELSALTLDAIPLLRQALDKAKGTHAFGDAYANDPLDSLLLWQFGYGRLQNLYIAADCNKREILCPGTYSSVVVLFADLSGFSGYVRDTPDHRTIRDCLSAFCTKARHQILSDGGMLYQFLGDAVIGLFGIPDRDRGYVERSYECAKSLLVLAESVSNEWQRQLDRLQPIGGGHVGMAMGDLELLSLRSFSRSHIGLIGDSINMAARLSSFAQSGQIAMSNIVFRGLCANSQQTLREAEPIEAKNIGRIKGWIYDSVNSPSHEMRKFN